MENNAERKCPMDCARCSLRQNMYCAAQIGLSTHELIIRLMERIEALEGKIHGIIGKVDDLTERLDALQADMLLEPMAQEREAVHTIDSQDKEEKK